VGATGQDRNSGPLLAGLDDLGGGGAERVEHDPPTVVCGCCGHS
jgi:hypothetical protein